MMIDNSYGPLIQSLPLTLAHYIGEEPTSTSGVQRKCPESSEVLGYETEAAAAVDLEAQNPACVGISTNSKEIAALNMTSEDEPDITHRDPTDYGFAHPAASRPQRTIWMATDTLGLSAEEMESLQERGIDVSISDARMDAMGNVTIQGPPPDGESRS
jgi:calcium permeable stress-gated cation channel